MNKITGEMNKKLKEEIKKAVFFIFTSINFINPKGLRMLKKEVLVGSGTGHEISHLE